MKGKWPPLAWAAWQFFLVLCHVDTNGVLQALHSALPGFGPCANVIPFFLQLDYLLLQWVLSDFCWAEWASKTLEGGVKLETSRYKWSKTSRKHQEKIQYLLDSCYLKCDHHTCSMDMTWPFRRNADSPAPPQTYWIRICIVSTSPLIHVHINIWEAIA